MRLHSTNSVNTLLFESFDLMARYCAAFNNWNVKIMKVCRCAFMNASVQNLFCYLNA